jgi:hypothetical protein
MMTAKYLRKPYKHIQTDVLRYENMCTYIQVYSCMPLLHKAPFVSL